MKLSGLEKEIIAKLRIALRRAEADEKQRGNSVGVKVAVEVYNHLQLAIGESLVLKKKVRWAAK